VDPRERIVVLEDTAELVPDARHVVRLEARAATVDGVRAITLADLVRTALRLRPDRLVVGEVRGDEVVALVQAMNTGHDGSLSTCHANSALDTLHRLETLVLHAAPSWPMPAVRTHLTRSIDVIVHVERGAGGSRRVAEVVEVVESDGPPRVRPLTTATAVVARLQRRRDSGRR
jgi:pilus assembly protein CpaF